MLSLLAAQPMPGTEATSSPFSSRDREWLGFAAGGCLKKVSVGCGAAPTITINAYGGESWGSQGMIAFPPGNASPLQQVPDAGGAPQALTRFEKGEGSHRWPEFLPGNKAVLLAA